MNPSFELYRDVANAYRWRLRAANGAIIADSAEGYVDKRDARHGLDLVRELAPAAPLEDLTAAGPDPAGNGPGDSAPPPYDLGPLPPELDLRWPHPPTLEHDRAITAGDAARCDQPHTRYEVRTDLDRLTIAASDVAVHVAEGFRVGHVFVERSVQRVRFDGGRYGALELAVPADFTADPPVWNEDWLVEDVLIDDVEIDADDRALAVRGKRIAVLRSRLHARRYPLWVGDTDGFESEDLIVAGNELVAEGPEATLRMVSVRRSAVVENVLRNPQKHNYRVEGRSDLAFAARNVFVDAGLMLASQPDDEVGTVWFQDNTLHNRTPSLLVVDRPPGSKLQRFVASGNTIYSDVWDCFLCVDAPPEWEVAAHPVAPYRPYDPH